MPKKVDHARRREELAALVVAVVEAEGPEAATFRRIADAGQFSIGVLTHYFRDKDELIGCAFEWLARRAFAALDERLDAVPEGLAQLTAALTFMVPLRGEVSYPGVWLALWTAARRNPALAAVHREYYARWRRRLLQALRCAHRRGEVTAPLSLADQLDLLVSGIDGLWLGIVNDPRRYPPARRERLVRALIEALVRPVAH